MNTDSYFNGSKIYFPNSDVTSNIAGKQLLKLEGKNTQGVVTRFSLDQFFGYLEWRNDVNQSIIYWDSTDSLYNLKTSYSGDQSLLPSTILTAGDILTYFDKIGSGSGSGLLTNLNIGSITNTTLSVTNSNGSGIILPSATQTLAGLLSAVDKTKIDIFETRLTAIETAQPTFDDVLVVASLPTTGETGKQYIVTSGANKGQTFYWNGTTYDQADQDVVMFTNLATFPATGEDGKIYVDKTARKSYMWNGTVYVELVTTIAISNSLISSANTITSTINGVVATAPIVNTNALSLTGSSLTSTVNGVASTALNLSTLVPATTVSNTLTGANLTTTVNAVVGTPVNLTPLLTSATTNTLTSAVNTLTSTINGVVATAPIVNTNLLSFNTTTNQLTGTINGIATTPITIPVEYNKYEFYYQNGAGNVGLLIETASLSISQPEIALSFNAVVTEGTTVATTITIENLTGTVYATLVIPAGATIGALNTGTINTVTIPANELLLIRNSVANLSASIISTLTTK